jgi:pilus assembly protein Flp/PilA
LVSDCLDGAPLVVTTTLRLVKKRRETMRNLMTAIVAFIRDEEGLTMVEYAIAGALVTAAAVAAFTLLGTNIGLQVTDLANTVGTP